MRFGYWSKEVRLKADPTYKTVRLKADPTFETNGDILETRRPRIAKSQKMCKLSGGVDGTRTRGLGRDRPMAG